MHSFWKTYQSWVVLAIAVVLAGGVFAYAYVQTDNLHKQIASLSGDLASTTDTLQKTSDTLSKDIAMLNSQTAGLSRGLAVTRDDIASATKDISTVQNQVGGVEQTVGSLASTTATLQKLATTDPELLKKYSKVYFLNENYTPAHLTQIPQAEVYSNTKPEQYLSEAMPFLQAMLTAASSSNATMYVASAYRSFGTQAALKSEYVMTYGEGANTFSADQGYSEHQLGTTVDLITTGMGGELTTDFAKTDAFKWLQANAYKYGFEMSYPEGNSYYQYEPWHWRFVGVKLTNYLHKNSMNFYDMDQRAIDAYLPDLFDPITSSATAS